jgi:hypothetical protein
VESREVPVDKAEYAKFCYLIKVMDALDRADELVRSDIKELRSTEGIRAEREFDWRQVERHCFPQLVISFLRGAERFEEDRSFRTFPRYVIVPRTADVVDLNATFELVLESPDTDNSVESVGDALRVIQSYVQHREDGAAANATQLLRQLSRVLKVKL